MADLTTVRRALAAASNTHIVFHLAGSVGASPDFTLVLPTYQSHFSGTVNVLLSATEVGVRRIILAQLCTMCLVVSTHSVVAGCGRKVGASGYRRMFQRLYETPVLFLRPFTTYGPGQTATKLIPSVTLSLLKGEVPEGIQRKADGRLDLHRRCDRGLPCSGDDSRDRWSTIDLGSGSLVSICDIVTELVEVVGSQVEPLFGALPDRPAEGEVAAETLLLPGC